MTPRLCRLCGERPVPPCRIKEHDFRCSICRRSTAAYRASQARYEALPRRREAQRVKAADRAKRRIMVGRRYHSMAKTPEEARRINAHIKGRLNEPLP